MVVRQVIEEERREREEAKRIREQAEILESQRGKDVSDSELMNKMFDFLEDENSSTADGGKQTDAYGMFYEDWIRIVICYGSYELVTSSWGFRCSYVMGRQVLALIYPFCVC